MLIIQGSSRVDGHTAMICDKINQSKEAEIINLCELNIAPFNYSGPTNDDFEKIIHKIISHKHVVWATPVYWYTMSGQMKVFLDRISDLLKWNKDLGRKLRGVDMDVVSCSGHDDGPDHFSTPFEMTADYLGMHYGNYIHTWIENGEISAISNLRIDDFLQKMNNKQ